MLRYPLYLVQTSLDINRTLTRYVPVLTYSKYSTSTGTGTTIEAIKPSRRHPGPGIEIDDDVIAHHLTIIK